MGKSHCHNGKTKLYFGMISTINIPLTSAEADVANWLQWAKAIVSCYTSEPKKKEKKEEKDNQ